MSDDPPPLPVTDDVALIESFCAAAAALARIRDRMTTDGALRRVERAAR